MVIITSKISKISNVGKVGKVSKLVIIIIMSKVSKYLCRHLLESLQHLLPSSLQKITNHINQTFVCIHEASQTSPSWTAYLQQIDSTLLAGLKHLLLTVLANLVQKATRYEQGAPISPLVMVQLELQGGDIQFSPPLSGHSAISSVPEVVQKWMNDYLSLTKLIPRCVH